MKGGPSHSLGAYRLALLACAGVGLACAFACGGSSGSSDNGNAGDDGGASSSGGSTSSGGTSSGSSTSSGGSTSSSTGGSTSSGGTSSGGGDGGKDASTAATTIFTFVFENHDYAEIVGSPNAPYFNSLIAKYGLATNYMDSGVHPSLPNYLTLVSGSAQGIAVDIDPTQSPFPVNQPNLGNQLQTAGVKWRSYQESMGTPCKLAGSGDYAPRHDGFLYFTGIQKDPNQLCANTQVDYTSFATDLATGTYRYMWVTPNLTDDGHNPSKTATDIVTALKDSDTWASNEIGKLMQSPQYLNGGIIFITWDEAEGRNGDSKDQVPMIIVSERIKSAGYKSNKPYSHKSYLATVEDLLALPRLATVTNEPNMLEFLQ